jgi:hypothetical protein
VSREGFNGTLTGTTTNSFLINNPNPNRDNSLRQGPYDGIREFTAAMRAHSGGWFVDMQDHEDFKYTDNLPLGQVGTSQIMAVITHI